MSANANGLGGSRGLTARESEAEEETTEKKPLRYFWIGMLAATIFSLLAFCAVCAINDNRKRKYYAVGCIPGLFLSVVVGFGLFLLAGSLGLVL